MEKACSYCESMVHDSSMRLTCNNGTPVSHGFKLFGVRLDTSEAATSAIKKSCCSVECISPSLSNVSLPGNPSKFSTGHLSNSLKRHPQNRKKGVSWTQDEHRKFLAGLAKLGKGDWKGISKHFVQSRTPTQVASHAQKYFLKQNILNKKREMPSLFTMQTENNENVYLNAPRNTHGHALDNSEALWLKYAKRYYSEAFFRQTNYLQSPMRRLLVSSWLYNSKGLSSYPTCNYELKSVEAEPTLELALAVEAPKQRDSKTCWIP